MITKGLTVCVSDPLFLRMSYMASSCDYNFSKAVKLYDSSQGGEIIGFRFPVMHR
jgi:hypothetical protein